LAAIHASAAAHGGQFGDVTIQTRGSAAAFATVDDVPLVAVIDARG
jgi:hypothetical protein